MALNATLFVIACLDITQADTCVTQKVPLERPISVEECRSIIAGVEAYHFYEALHAPNMKWHGWMCRYDDGTI